MSESYQIYKIDKIINSIVESNVDEETGEIKEDAIELINNLELEKEVVYKDVALMHLQENLSADIVKAEITRLRALESSHKSKAEFCKRLLQKFIPEGQKYNFDIVKIGWRSSEEIITDPFLDLEALEKKYPELVKVTRELKKTETKKLYKEQRILPEHISINPKQNIQIK